MSRLLGNRFGIPVLLSLFALAVFFCVRTVLLLQSFAQVEHGVLDILAVYGVGLVYDLIVCVYAFAPLAVLLVLMPDRLYGSTMHRYVAHVIFFGLLSGLMFVGIAEWFFWDEFGVRFNFIAVDYLVYRREVTGNIYESYPVLLILTALFVVAGVVLYLLRRRVATALEGPRTGRHRIFGALTASVLFAGVFVFTNDSYARFSHNAYLTELAENGIYQFFFAFEHNELDYDTFYRTIDLPSVDRELRAQVLGPHDTFLSSAPLDITRRVDNPGAEKHLNVVLVVVESLSADYMAAFGNREDITPNLDRLAGESLFFSNLYALGNRTVRGLEAITLSLPPTPGSAIVRRPDNAGMFSLGSVFRDKGYDVRFLYGGYGYFDNMNAFFSGNGFAVTDRASLAADESEYATVWGVADEFIYKRTLREADKSYAARKPFFSLVMTTSNHRPYGIPAGRITDPAGHPHLKAVKYTDWAINHLIEEARSKPWFADTVFVIVADHCAGSAGKTALPVQRYHIPMLIYSPQHVAPQRVTQLASQMDFAPTLLALLGFDYDSRFIGRDTLATPPAEARALMATYQRMGYLAGDQLVILSPQQRVDAVTDPFGAYRETQLALADAQADAAVRRAITYYQGAAWRNIQRLDRELPRSAAH